MEHISIATLSTDLTNRAKARSITNESLHSIAQIATKLKDEVNAIAEWWQFVIKTLSPVKSATGRLTVGNVSDETVLQLSMDLQTIIRACQAYGDVVSFYIFNPCQ
jgi:hypothetical protein